MPKVTVLMPTYNVAPWVEEAIRSVLSQSFKDFILLVMDDCSSDNTLDVVRGIEDSRIQIERNDHNLGLSENLNRGLSFITTEYVSRMDGDDIAEPTWLEKEIAILDAHPEIGICGAGFQRFGTSHSLVRFPEYHEDTAAQMLFSCSVIVPTFRMSLYHKQKLRYRADAFPAEDYWFWADCLRHTKIYNIQETLFHYRMHASQICTSKRDIQQVKVAEVRRYMLQWLNPNIPEPQVQYFLNNFVLGNISNKFVYHQYKSFSDYLINKNDEVGHFSKQALHKCFHNHIVLSLYDTIVNKYFAQGYSIRNYFSYLFSGLSFHTNFRYESKFFLKSLLRRKA